MEQKARVTPLRISPLLITALLALVLSPILCDSGVGREGGLLHAVEIPAKMTTGIVAGKVTDGITGAPIAYAAVTFEPTVDEMHLSVDLHPIRDKVHLSTDSTGFFYAKVPVGPYRLTFSKGRHRSAEQRVLISPGQKVTADVVLDPTDPVILYAGKEMTGATPGSPVSLKAAVFIRDGSTLKSLNWMVRPEQGRVSAVVSEKKDLGVTVILPGAASYKKALLDRLGKGGRLLNRWMVLGLGPSDLKEAGKTTLEVTAITTSGKYSDTVDIIADFADFAVVNPGLQNVPIRESVLLQGKDQASYRWNLAGPAGSAATLKDAETQTPHFTPDVPGLYTLTEGGKARLKVFAGTWSGAIVVKTAINKPWFGRKGCACHLNDRITPRFMASWASGHAEIFTYNITTSYRYEEKCFACHTVGFRKAANGGIKDDPAYEAFLKDATLWDLGKVPPVAKPGPGNWDYILDTYLGVARFTNVQCENCHGPSNSEAHKTLKTTGAPERMSLSPDVCGACHDESVDVSYRQWQDSGHSNYKLAMEVATVEKRGDGAKNCGRCHAGQGFLVWTSQHKRTKEIQRVGDDPFLAELTDSGLTIERVHPLTCVICHDSHESGSSFRAQTDKVPVRISSDARMHPVEFGSNPGGREALCIICHSTDSGPYNDVASALVNSVWAPHAAQADVLMGQNAFFVEIGKNKSHSRIEDNCIWCHMKPVPAKSGSGYPRGGVNHTFKTPRDLCSRCHKEFEREGLMASIQRDLDRLKGAIEASIFRIIKSKLTVKLIKAANDHTDVVLKASDIQKLELVQFHGEMAVNVFTTQKIYKVPLSHIHLDGVPLVPTDYGQVIAKAAWNYLLLKNDGSKGAHNPQFTAEVLDATMTKLGTQRF